MNTYSIGSKISPQKNGPTIIYPSATDNQEMINLKFGKYFKWMMELVSHIVGLVFYKRFINACE